MTAAALLTRRRLLRGGIAAAGLVAAPAVLRLIPATASAPLIRHDIASPQGQAMLEIYAVAVARMMALPPSDPLSWAYQWNIHAIRNDRSRAAELAALSADPSDARRVAAEALWDTCEAHFDPRRVDFFLPWHRLFCWRTERIVRRLTGERRFTMPYWDYTDPQKRALPAEFRKAGDPFWGALYRPDRNPGINDGAPIDRDAEAAIDLGAMMSAIYRDSGTGDAGLSFNLDNAPHAAVHIDVGTRARGMGALAWAANDPIFWPHHATIDRIWESWNRAGGRNPDDPDFLATSFAFIDADGQPARSTVGDAIDIAKLGYAYDRYLERPNGSLPFGATRSVTEHAARRDTVAPIRLASAAVTAPLAAPPDFAAALADADRADRAFILRTGGVRVLRQPKVSYRLYLAPEPGSTTPPDDTAYIGAINAFGAIPRGETQPGNAAETFPRAYSFVVTERVRALLRGGRLSGPPHLILVPTGIPASDAIATIDEIALLSS